MKQLKRNILEIWHDNPKFGPFMDEKHRIESTIQANAYFQTLNHNGFKATANFGLVGFR